MPKISKKDKEQSILEELFESGVVKKGNDNSFVYSRILFNIEPLDILTGGGIPTKRLTLVTGQTNAGKSYLCLQLVKSVQGVGGTVAWIDAEWSWDVEWVEKCGINPENVLVSQPESGEKTFEVVRGLMKSGINLIVVDSVAALIPASLNVEDFSHNPMAVKARMINDGISRLLPNLEKGTALVFINQLRSGIGPYAMDVYPGGEGQSFFAHMILQVRREGWIEETINGQKTRVGFDIEVRQRKSKVKGASYDSCTVPFRLEGGVDLMELTIEELIERGKIIKSGIWYSFIGNEEKFGGKNALKKYFLESPNILENLRKD